MGASAPEWLCRASTVISTFDPARLDCYTFSVMLHSPAFIPLLHGEVGILDELLLFGAPLVVVIIILVIASRRARKNAPPQKRTRSSSQTVQPSNDSTDTPP